MIQTFTIVEITYDQKGMHDINDLLDLLRLPSSVACVSR